MRRLRKTIAVCLIAVLGVVSFTGCGHDEEKTAGVPDRTSLSGSVTVAVAEGDAYNTVGKLSGDIKINKVAGQQDVLKQLKNGKCDFAVLTPIEAARYYNENGGIKVVTTLALGDWKIAGSDYDSEEAPELSYMAGRIVSGLQDEAESSSVENDGEEAGEYGEGQGEIDQYAEEQPMEEPEEIIETREMSQEVFEALMAEEKIGYYDGQIQWTEFADIENALNRYGAAVMGTEKNVSKVIAGKEEFKELFSLSELWGEEFEGEIPGYVLVATDSFLKDRNYEVEGVLDIIADKIEANQDSSDLKLVAYNMSNRGTMIVRDFLEIMAEENPDAVEGEAPAVSFYWSGK